MAENNYLSAVATDPDTPGGFAHSGYLILVDEHRRIRGVYLGTEDSQVAQLIKDIQILLKKK